MRARWINGWHLFVLTSATITAFMLVRLVSTDFSSPQDLSAMIQYSVRWAVPFIFLVIAISALYRLFPGDVTRWLMRNRRYIGLSFAVAMAWQGAFIFIVSYFHSEHYYAEIYYLRDELEGSSGYLLLVAMTLTSFGVFRRHMSPGQWRFLHLSGVTFLWAYPFSVYWWNVFYYKTQYWFDVLFYVLGFAAFALRILAWGRKRIEDDVAWFQRGIGGCVMLCSLWLAATGHFWQPALSAAVLSRPWSAELELWLPFWPFEPFLPLVTLALGVWFVSGAKVVNRLPRRAAA